MPLTRREFLIGTAGTLGSLTLVGRILDNLPAERRTKLITPEQDIVLTAPTDDTRVLEFWAWAPKQGGVAGLRRLNGNKLVELSVRAGMEHPIRWTPHPEDSPIGPTELYVTNDVEANAALLVGDEYWIVGAVHA